MERKEKNDEFKLHKDVLEGEELYQIETMADGLRNTGYKSTYNAIAEIVDNSIEADAKNVFVIGRKDLNINQEKIVEFAFLDDGFGMDEIQLSKCLTIGFSTRRERKGMGRFGVGLPQASFSVAPRVEVYSWTNGVKNAKRVYIDLDLVSDGKQKKVFPPESVEIPKEYKELFNLKISEKTYDFNKHGTLVIWKRCDKVNHKRWNTCKRYIETDLGRKYRWMINDGSVEISTLELSDLGTFTKILPNDPLFLMVKSQHCVKEYMDDNNAEVHPYDENEGYVESMFEPFTNEDNKTGVVDQPVYYFDRYGNKKYSSVQLRFSIIKEKYYTKTKIKKNPGDSPHGKIVKSNVGISVVRQKREIDFRFFDFADATNNPQHRWWGCEISFTPKLDEAFGISNNKQQVTLKGIDEEARNDFEGDEPMWLQLYPTISSTIKKMVARNKELRTGTRTPDPDDSATTDVSIIVKKAEEKFPEYAVEFDENPEKYTEEEIKSKVTSELADEGYATVSEEQIDQYLQSNTRVVYVKRGQRSAFLDFDSSLGVLRVIVNCENAFYTNYIEKSYEDENMKTIFELFLVSLVKTMYEQRKYYEKAVDKLLDGINNKLKSYLEIKDE